MKSPSRSRSDIFSLFLLSVLIMSACVGGSGRGVQPIVVTSLPAGFPLRDIVGRGGINYYAASVTPGALYKISITELSDDADLLVFGRDSSFSRLAACSIDTTSVPGATPEDCVITADGTTLYFGVDGTFLTTPSGAYTIDIERPSLTDLGLSVPVADSVQRTGLALYAAPVTPGQSYTAVLTDLSDDGELYVFGADASFKSQAACTIGNKELIGSGPEDCTLTAAGNVLYFAVDGLFSASSTVAYAAFVTPAPAAAVPVNEGTAAAPKSVTAGSPLIGQVGDAGVSYYTATGLTTGAQYTVSISGMTSNANLTVFADGAFTTLVSCLIDNTFLSGTTPEACTFVAAGAPFFSVSAGPNSGSFIILVEAGP